MRKITELPESFDELTNKQFDYIMHWVFKYSEKLIDYDDLKRIVVVKLLKLSYWKLAWQGLFKTRFFMLNRFAQINRITNHFDWLFTRQVNKNKKEVVNIFAYNSPRNYYPVLKSGNLNLIGPSDGLTDLTFGEYRHAVIYLEKFEQTNEEIYLNRLIGILYRPKRKDYKRAIESQNFDGRVKESFNINFIDKYAFNANKIKPHQKLATLWFFNNCLSFIRYSEVEVNGKLVKFSPLFEKMEGSGGNDKLGLTAMLYAISETKIFGSINDVDNTALYDILLHLLDKTLTYKELLRKNKK